MPDAVLFKPVYTTAGCSSATCGTSSALSNLSIDKIIIIGSCCLFEKLMTTHQQCNKVVLNSVYLN